MMGNRTRRGRTVFGVAMYAVAALGAMLIAPAIALVVVLLGVVAIPMLLRRAINRPRLQAAEGAHLAPVVDISDVRMRRAAPSATARRRA
jgi:hypothetical protein